MRWPLIAKQDYEVEMSLSQCGHAIMQSRAKLLRGFHVARTMRFAGQATETRYPAGLSTGGYLPAFLWRAQRALTAAIKRARPSGDIFRFFLPVPLGDR